MIKKVLYAATIIMLTAQSVFPVGAATECQIDNWSAFNNTHADEWQISWDAFGMPSRIIGGATAPGGATPEDIARNFLTEVADAFVLQEPDNQLRVAMIDTSWLGENFVIHVHLHEMLNDFPVFDCLIKVHISKDNTIHSANAIACRLDNPTDYVEPILDRKDAVALATAAISEGQIQSPEIKSEAGYIRTKTANLLVWRVHIPTRDPWHDWRVTINQHGTVLEVVDMVVYVSGQANVFSTNPYGGDPEEVEVVRLDGNGYLQGSYAYVEDAHQDHAYEPDHDFRYDTASHHFDEASVYYHLDLAQELAQDRGFPFYQAMSAAANWDACNAMYFGSNGAILVGNGPVENWEDCRNLSFEAAIIYHEYGHYITHKKSGYSPWDTGQPMAINEGVSDYFGCSWTNDPTILEWTMAEYPDMQRILDNNYHYPEDYDPGDYYVSSQLISGTLWEIRQALAPEWGSITVDELVISSLGYCTKSDTFTTYWCNIVEADKALRYSRDLGTIQTKFQNRGITAPDNTSPNITNVSFVGSPGTIYECQEYQVRAVAEQTGSSEGAYLEYRWEGEGSFTPVYSNPPDSVVVYTAPMHLPSEEPPLERSIIVKVYDGLGGYDTAILGPFLVYEVCECGFWGDLTCDDGVDPMDVAIIVNYVYRSQDARCYPECWNCPYDLGDVDCNEGIDPLDVVHYVNYVYKGLTPFPCEDPCE